MGWCPMVQASCPGKFICCYTFVTSIYPILLKITKFDYIAIIRIPLSYFYDILKAFLIHDTLCNNLQGNALQYFWREALATLGPREVKKTQGF